MSLSGPGERILSADVAEILALEQEATDLDATWVFTALARHWKIALLVPVLFALAGVVLASRKDKVYETSALLSLQPSAGETFVSSSTPGSSDRDIQTESQILNSSPFKAAVGAKLGRPADVRAQTVFNTSVISIIGRGATPARAIEMANAASDLYVAERRQRVIDDLGRAQKALTDKLGEVQAQLDALSARVAALPATPAGTTPPDNGLVAQRAALLTETSSLRDQITKIQVEAAVTTGGARVIARAQDPAAVVSPRPARDGFLFALLGVLAGILLAIVVERRSGGLGHHDELARRLSGVPILATVPPSGGMHRGVLLLAASQSPSAEAIRSLRTSVQFVGLDRPLRRIQVTSATDDEGATAIAANLAVAFAGAGLRVTVVDGDLRMPRLHEYFGVEGTRGFTTVLVGQTDLQDVLQPVAMQGWLRVLAAGPRPTNPSELLASGYLLRLLAELEDRCDLVIIDSPPVLPYTDAAVISTFVDTTVLVASARDSKVKSLHQALRTLRVVGAHLAGVVVSELEPQQTSTSSSGIFRRSSVL